MSATTAERTIATMAERKLDHRGLAAQRAILAELRRREKADEDPPGVRELARDLKRSLTAVRHQLAAMSDDGLVTVSAGSGRTPAAVRLTPAGRRSAELSTPP